MPLIDKKTLAQINENIKLLEEELEKLTSRPFGQHPIGAALAGQTPDQLPPAEETQPADQGKLRPVVKAQLVS
jgi:hypothetical protein